jgi:hypothetical protein
MPHGTHFHLGCHDTDLEVLMQLLVKGHEARSVNAVVIGQKDPHDVVPLLSRASVIARSLPGRKGKARPSCT